MLAKVYSGAVQGIDAIGVEIEVNATEIGEQLQVQMVGLPDAAVRESRQRVRSAMESSGFYHPPGTTIVSLAPADIKKEGAAYDLPIAVGMLAASRNIDRDLLHDKLMVGELALDGTIRPIRGVLPMALLARELKKTYMLVPMENAREAGIVEGVRVIGVGHLRDAVDFLRGDVEIEPTVTNVESFYEKQRDVAHDLADIKGQELVRRAMEVAAAGGHNILLIGPPGTGKTMIARRMSSILPLMTLEEAIEATKVHSICGQLDKDMPLVVERPFRSPHHTVSNAGLVGGSSTPHPGEISLAHNGVLFLDELPEFKRDVLEVMRQPLEDGEVTVSRAGGAVTFPSNFQLVAAMNPCPCGHFGSYQRECRCSVPQIQRYRSRISGPLLDRIDLHVEVLPLSEDELMNRSRGEDSLTVRERVLQAREMQLARYGGMRSGTLCNAMMTPREIQNICKLDNPCRSLLRVAINDLNLSARAYDRILRVARTLADLEGVMEIAVHHLSEAVQYRSLDRQLW